MKFDQLAYFLEVSKTEHIGRASRVLNVSPSAISHSVAALEDEIGYPLFERVGKNIHLSQQGKIFAQRIEPLLQEFKKAKQDLQSPHLPLEGTFRVAATHGLCAQFLTPALCELQKKNPKLQVEVYSLRSAQVVESVANGNFDMGICYSPTPHPRLEVDRLHEDPMSVAVRKDHPLLKLKGQELIRQLAEYPAANPKAFVGIEVREEHPALKKLKIQIQTDFIFDSYDVAAQKLRQSQNWCLMPEFFIRRYRLQKLAIADLNAKAYVCSILPKARPLPKAIAEWRSSLQNKFLEEL